MLTHYQRLLSLDRRRRALRDLQALLAGPHEITKTMSCCARCGCGVTLGIYTEGGRVPETADHQCEVRHDAD